MLGLAGAWPSWKDKRVKAVLAMSPYTAPFLLRHTLGGMHVPVMYQGGTRDIGITPGITKKDGAYDQTGSPKYYMELNGATHLAWTDITHSYHETIDNYAIAFFDLYLKGKPLPAALMQVQGNVAAVQADFGNASH